MYPTLKEVALAGSLGSKAMKQVSQQILSFAIKAAGESMPPSVLFHLILYFLVCESGKLYLLNLELDYVAVSYRHS